MSWNYRVVRYADGTGFGLHEVFYDADGQPWGMGENPARFVCDAGETPMEIVRTLAVARTDARLRGVLDEPATWPGVAPGDRHEGGS